MSTATKSKLTYEQRLARRRNLARDLGFPSLYNDRDGKAMPPPLPILLGGKVAVER
jgi:hypothetical protein